MKLSPERFNALLNGVGQRTEWRRAYSCPCINPASKAPSFQCPQCHGIGSVWAAPVNGMVALSGQKLQRAWAQFGAWQNGDVVVTIPSDSPLYVLGEADRVVLSDSSAPFSNTLVRGDNDKLNFSVVTVDRVFWLVNNQITEGGIPTVGVDGTLTWVDGEPPAGTQYSVTGRQRPEYFVYGDFPQDRAHQQGTALPRRVVLRSFDLFRRAI